MDVGQVVLDRLFLLLQRIGRWPQWEELDRELYRTRGVADPWETVRAVDRDLLWGIGVDDIEPELGRVVGLTVAGLARAQGAREDVQLFVDGLRLAAELGLENPDADVRLSPALLSEKLALPAAGRDDLLLRQHAVWQTEGRLWRSMSRASGDGDWSVLINHRAVRRFAGVANADGYLQISARTPTSAGLSITDVEKGGVRGFGGDTTLESAGSEESPALASGGIGRDTGRPVERLVGSSLVEYFWFPDEVLGSGGYGREVFAGQGPDGAPVAVKRVPLRGFDTRKWMEDGRYAERELEVHKHLRAGEVAHVLDLLDEALTDDALFLISPRAEFSLGAVARVVGGTVNPASVGDVAAKDFYGAGGPTPDQVRVVAADLARGLVELHEADVLHRDVKPDNSVLHDGKWKWCDLGTSRVLSDVTSTYTLREHGTLAYQAPEVTRGEPQSGASDVYAFGCTLYALSTGGPPFAGTPDELVRQHRDAVPDLRPIADVRLAELLGWMLKKVPEGRIDAAGVLTWLLDPPDPNDATNAKLAALAAAADVRQAARATAEGRLAVRLQAAEAADALLDQLWARFATRVRRTIPTIQTNSAAGSYILTWDDRRILVLFSEPADRTCSAVRLGTVIVEAEDSSPRIEVANICAFPQTGGRPLWKLLRMRRNDGATRPSRVTEALSDGLGAVSLHDLETHLREREDGVMFKAATAATEVLLTAEALEQLFADEVAAVDAELAAQSAQPRREDRGAQTPAPPSPTQELSVLRTSVLKLAEEVGLPVPIRATGHNPTVVTFSDGRVASYFSNLAKYKTAMNARKVDPLRSFASAPPTPVSGWSRTKLEDWIATHGG